MENKENINKQRSKNKTEEKHADDIPANATSIKESKDTNLAADREDQEQSDQNKIQEIREKLNPVDWKEFWKKQQRNSPTRKDVFPNEEDKDMSEKKIVDALNKYFGEHESSLWNMSGIDAEEFPEVIDADIRDVCVKLNRLPYLKTLEGCGGHETNRLGKISDIGYSEPYLVFYAQEENQEFQKFLKQLDENMEQFRKKDLPGMENVVLDRTVEDCQVEVEGIKIYNYDVVIVPTKEWCDRHNEKYIERPKSPGPYYEWCPKNGFEYSEDEDSESRIKWNEEKKEHWKKIEGYGKEYGEYFRSDEVKKIRDEFFKAFDYDRADEIRQEITSSINAIKKTGLFDQDYLDNLTLVSFGKNKTYKFKSYAISNIPGEEFDMRAFMQGRRTDFAGINPKKEFESRDMRALDDKPFLPFIFIDGKQSYDEFVTHEIAHNLFDKEYAERVGQYKEVDNTTDVSEEYREKIKDLIIPLVKKHYPNIKAERFSFSRPQIAEIFTIDLLLFRQRC